MTEVENKTTEVATTAATTEKVVGTKLFGRWDYSEIKIEDLSYKDYIAVTTTKSQVYIPHTAGRWQVKKFRKAQCPIIERFVNSLMFHGRNAGKKALSIRIIRHTLEIIHLMTGKNPLEIVVQAVINSGPREDSTRIGTAGVVRKQAVDVSPLRRVNLAIHLLTTGARDATFRTMKSMSECLADELMNAAKGTTNSFAVRKKDEIEKVAKGNR